MNRRRFLGGAAALVGLPLLESLAPRRARAAGVTGPLRFVVVYIPNGIHKRDWRPPAPTTGTEGPLELLPGLASLAPIRDRVTLIGGLSNVSAEGGDGAHARGTGCFLTSTPILKSEDRVQSGVSLDQALVQALAPPTRFPSLQLGLEGGAYSGGCDASYSCAYQRSISWAGPSTPLQKIVSPEVLFDRMFAGTELAATLAERDRRRRTEASVLDRVRADAASLNTELGTQDRRKLDEYLTGLRELERRVTAPEVGGRCEAIPPEARGPRDRAAHARVMADLLVTALRCDLTRFVTHMIANSGSSRTYEFLGVEGEHHDASHHDDEPEKLEWYRTIVAWQVSQMSYIAQRMAEIDEGGVSLLDRSLVLLSSEISDGNAHDHRDLPVILAGSAGGAIRTGRYFQPAREEPIANLFVSILGLFGAPADSFGRDGTRPLEGLA